MRRANAPPDLHRIHHDFTALLPPRQDSDTQSLKQRSDSLVLVGLTNSGNPRNLAVCQSLSIMCLFLT
jgi:hypothetical protein